MSTLLALFLSHLERYVSRLKIRGRKAIGLCPFHAEKTPSFSADLEKGVFHCFGCGQSGGVKRFAELVGESWTSTRSESRTAKARRTALTAARDAYTRWQRAKLIALTDEYRELVDEREVTEIGYRAAYRRPDLYSENDRLFWSQRLADLYNRIEELEYSLDLLTFDKWEAERFSWWQEVEERGQLAA